MLDSSDRMNANFDLADGIAVLVRTPATFRALLSGLPDSGITADEGPDTFSPFDNVGHLIHGDRSDWIPRARIILAQLLAPRVTHDLGHLAQTVRVMAKRHRDAVGPWRAYFPVRDR